MNELKRLAYMEAMVVDCYSPRLRLPGALASQLCVLPLPSMRGAVDHIAEASPALADKAALGDKLAAPVVKSDTATNPASGIGAAAAMQALLGDSSAAVVKTVANVSAKNASRTIDGRQDIPHFSLSIIRGSNVLILDDGMTGEVDPSEYLQLLMNMLYALGAGKQQLSIDTFVWPMVKNSQIDQSETAARQTLQAIIGKQIERLPSSVVLILGDTPAKYLSEQTITAGEWVVHPLMPVQLLRSHSACSMLSNPQIKKTVWQHLQPLYQLFNNQ